MAVKMAKKVRNAQGVTFTFADKGATQLSFTLAELPEAMVQELAAHGLSQKLGDSYASLASPAEGIAAVNAVWKNLKAGIFNATGGGSSGGLLAEAIARIKGVTVEAAVAAIEAMSDEKLETVKANSKVKATIKVIQGERAATKLKGEEAEVEFDL